MFSLEKAIRRVEDRCNLDLQKDDDCIVKYMYQYKAIADLDDAAFWDVYDEITFELGLQERGA